MANKIVQLQDKDGNNIYPIGAGDTLANFTEKIYPVGSDYYTKDTTYNPNVKLGGTWVKLGTNIPMRRFIGSQCILKGPNTYSGAQVTNLIGAYGYNLIEGVFDNVDIPNGYHKAYRMTAQCHTQASNNVRARLNNIATEWGCTWDGSSGKTFRKIISSSFFKESDITLEPTMNYSNNGINLKYQNDGSSSGTLWSVTIHGYIESDDKYIAWQRTT